MANKEELEQSYNRVFGASKELNLLIDFVESSNVQVPQELKAYLVTRSLEHVIECSRLSSEFEKFKKSINY